MEHLGVPAQREGEGERESKRWVGLEIGVSSCSASVKPGSERVRPSICSPEVGPAQSSSNLYIVINPRLGFRSFRGRMRAASAVLPISRYT